MESILKQLGNPDVEYPFILKNNGGREIYREDSGGYWYKYEFDSNGNRIYYENSKGYWQKCEFDERGEEIYFENSRGYWYKYEFDSNGNQIYYENSKGQIIDNCVRELTIDDIAEKFGVSADKIKIKK